LFALHAETGCNLSAHGARIIHPLFAGTGVGIPRIEDYRLSAAILQIFATNVQRRSLHLICRIDRSSIGRTVRNDQRYVEFGRTSLDTTVGTRSAKTARGAYVPICDYIHSPVSFESV
jgi:hypothetical protein